MTRKPLGFTTRPMQTICPIPSRKGTNGFGETQLRNAFNKVANALDWRAPISSIIPISEIEITREAIAYFTGCVAQFKGRKLYGKYDDPENVIVTCEGYRNGPCGS